MDARTWDPIIASFQNPHLLQTWEWGEFKARNQWTPIPILWYGEDSEISCYPFPKNELMTSGQSPLAAALVLERKKNITGPIGGSLKVLYVPKGPALFHWENESLRRQVLDDLNDFARKKQAIFIKIDPDVPKGTGKSGDQNETVDPVGQAVLDDLMNRGWNFSNEQIQFRNTVTIDLTASEDELLSRMKQKTRYNVRLAGRKGVKVRRGGMEDLPSVYDMYAATSVRDGFVIRGQDYYKAAWGNFLQAKMADLLIAEVDEEPVAGLFLYYFARKAWYLYGMSHTLHREKMPSSLLQWEAIKCAKDKGCTVYDLWGAPDVFDSSDPMWGVYRFKEGLGGQVVRHIGAWDLPIRPLYYRLYAQFMPKILNVLRMRGKSITRQDFAA
jgi:lipid II:glycine glycyltransferase (peptidoglycan interpeptide bridge formation enzyme)